MKQIYGAVIGSILMTGFTGVANASSVTFATFTETHPQQQGVKYKGGPAGSLQVSNLDVQFRVGSYGPIDPAVYQKKTFEALFSMTATDSHGSDLNFQTLSGLDTLSFKFVYHNSANPSDPLNGKILLAGTAGASTPGGSGDPGYGGGPAGTSPLGAGALQAANNAQSGNIHGSNRPGKTGTMYNYIKFSSDLLHTAGITDENYSFSLTSASPAFSYTGVYLNSFNAAIGGQFAAKGVPEPGSIALAVGALVSMSALKLRRRRK